MAFYVGQRVQCVDAAPIHGRKHNVKLVEGKVYTFRWSGPVRDQVENGTPGIRLEGINRGDCGNRMYDLPYRAERFRPLVETTTDISVFTSLLTPKPVPERV